MKQPGENWTGHRIEPLEHRQGIHKCHVTNESTTFIVTQSAYTEEKCSKLFTYSLYQVLGQLFRLLKAGKSWMTGKHTHNDHIHIPQHGSTSMIEHLHNLDYSSSMIAYFAAHNMRYLTRNTAIPHTLYGYRSIIA